MAKKQFTGALDVLGVVDPYGAKVGSAEGEMLITPELDACRPDPHQPRHVMPDDLRGRLASGASPSDVLWEAWRRCLGEELYHELRSHALTPAEALARRREAGAPDGSTGPEALALQLTLEGLAELAGSIARHGLRQPINVYELGAGKYRIAEGERRWWAHVLLRDAMLRVEASTILARVHPLPGDALAVLARQEAENAHRRDLSAIARARAIATVREAVAREVSVAGGNPNSTPPPPQPAVSAAGGSPNPGGRPRRLDAITSHQLDDLTGQRLAELAGNGLAGSTIRLHLALLALPQQAQDLAEAAGLSERALRPIVSLDDAAEQVRLVHALAAGELTPARAATEARRLAGWEQERGGEGKDTYALARFRASLRFAARDLPDPAPLAAQIAGLPPGKRDETLACLRRYAAFLQAVLEAEKGAFQAG